MKGPTDVSGNEIKYGDKVEPIGPYYGAPAFIVDEVSYNNGWMISGKTKEGHRSNTWNALYLNVVYSPSELVPNPS